MLYVNDFKTILHEISSTTASHEYTVAKHIGWCNFIEWNKTFHADLALPWSSNIRGLTVTFSSSGLLIQKKLVEELRDGIDTYKEYIGTSMF